MGLPSRRWLSEFLADRTALYVLPSNTLERTGLSFRGRREQYGRRDQREPYADERLSPAACVHIHQKLERARGFRPRVSTQNNNGARGIRTASEKGNGRRVTS
jgi:hypothetical protein